MDFSIWRITGNRSILLTMSVCKLWSHQYLLPGKIYFPTRCYYERTKNPNSSIESDCLDQIIYQNSIHLIVCFRTNGMEYCIYEFMFRLTVKVFHNSNAIQSARHKSASRKICKYWKLTIWTYRTLFTCTTSTLKTKI